MAPDYKKIFSALDTIEPPAGLSEKVLARIAMRERRALAIKIGASASIFIVSVAVMVVGGMNLFVNLVHSGFIQILGLAFSDFSLVAANFSDFIYSAIESFPIFTAALLLSALMAAIWSMASLVDEASLMRNNALLRRR